MLKVAIFVIADLHLSFKNPKPMTIFGENWESHEEKIKEDWKKNVKREDTVVLPGDFSWAMNLEDTYLDFSYLEQLPGKKLLLKGNHDYWWTTLTKMRKYLEENQFTSIDFIYNNSYEIENYVVTGTRGWTLNDIEGNSKILNRELARLELSLQEGKEKYTQEKERIVFMHYPPITHSALLNHSELKFVELMKQYQVKRCFYGHLHSRSHKDAIEGNIEGIQFQLISGDYLDFKLLKI